MGSLTFNQFKCAFRKLRGATSKQFDTEGEILILLDHTRNFVLFVASN